MHCPHLFKVGAKMQACQESVSDPSDLVHALKVMFEIVPVRKHNSLVSETSCADGFR